MSDAPQYDAALFQRAMHLVEWRNNGKIRDALTAYTLGHGLLSERGHSPAERHSWILWVREAEQTLVAFVTASAPPCVLPHP